MSRSWDKIIEQLIENAPEPTTEQINAAQQLLNHESFCSGDLKRVA